MIHIKQKLDPIFETYALLFLAHQKEHYFHMIEDSLNNLGLQGEEIVKSNLFTILRQYLDAFAKHWMAPDQSSIIYKLKEERSMIALLDFVSDLSKAMDSPKLFLANLTESHVIEKLISYFSRITTRKVVEGASDFDTLFNYIMDSEIDDAAKWIFVSLAKSPKDFFEEMILTVKENIGAFEKAAQQVRPELDVLLQEFVSHLEENKEENVFKKLNISFRADLVIYPTLALCGSSLFYHNFYYGLFHDQLLLGNDVSSSNKNDLLVKTKALSDKSKLEILLSLREKPKYSLELSEAMSLSPSTTSHHMNLLVLSGLVNVKKERGKSYYHVNEEGIQKLKDEIDYFFA